MSTSHELRPLTSTQLKQLFADLNPARIASRSQGGAKLSYLEAWDVRATLIRVFGFGGWSVRMVETEVVKLTEGPHPTDSKKTRVYAAVRSTVELTIHQLGAVYSDTAVSSQTGSDVGDVLDFAQKTSSSDALKRCAMNLGTAFGLSLYNKGAIADVVRLTRAPGQTKADIDLLAHEEQQNRTRALTAAGLISPDNTPLPQIGGERITDEVGYQVESEQPVEEQQIAEPMEQAAATSAVQGAFDRTRMMPAGNKGPGGAQRPPRSRAPRELDSNLAAEAERQDAKDD